MSGLRGWIGVDLDGTLAHYDGWKGADHIGPPVEAMLSRLKQWIKDGRDVRILTARVSHDGSHARMVEAQMATIHIMDWCARYVGTVLPVTCTKDFAMIELWDDRAVTVLPNLGRPCCNLAREASRVLQDEGHKKSACYARALAEVPGDAAALKEGALDGWFLVDKSSNVYKQRDEASGRVALAMLEKNQPELGFVLTRLCRFSGEGVST